MFDPTFNIYVASRDVMRMRTAEWHDQYTLPSLMEFFQPSTNAHGSYYWDWTTEIETKWKRFYDVMFRLIRDYHSIGGRVTTGSDDGFIYQTYGFGYIMELELLREAGLSPREVMRSATSNGAKTLYEPKGIRNPPIGTVQAGKLADLLVCRRTRWRTSSRCTPRGTCGSTRRRTRSSASGACASRSRTGSPTTPRGCAPTSARWSKSRRRRPPACARRSA